MITGTPDARQIRQYLLGRLDENEELENTLSESILFRNDVAELTDLIEDEIIEQYLDGTLDAADKNDFEKYFLRPAERRERLQFARLLRERLHTPKAHGISPNPDVNTSARTDTSIAGAFYAQSVPRHSFLKTYGQLAALVLICIASITYISSLQNKQGRLEASLVQERDRAATLEKQSLLLQSRTPPLYLVANRDRALAAIPYVEIKPSTEHALIDLALGGGVNGEAYDVGLKKAGTMESIWSAKLPCVVSPTGDARLVFDLPVQGLTSGRYSLIVSSTRTGSSSQDHYDFEARVTQ